MVNYWARPNEVKTAVQWFHMSHEVFAGFSGHGNSIYYRFIFIERSYLQMHIFV